MVPSYFREWRGPLLHYRGLGAVGELFGGVGAGHVQLIELTEMAQINPALAFEVKRVAALVEYLVKNTVVRGRGGGGIAQSLGPGHGVDIGDSGGTVTQSQVSFGRD